MVTDPSWLYSTIAQSSAAIVAIVGGFITATVLMLMAEKRNLEHQLADEKARIEALKKQREELLEDYETLKVHEFLYSITDELISADELPSLEVMMQSHSEIHNLNPEALKREYEKLSKHVLEARHFIEQHLDKINVMQAITFDEWVESNNLDIGAYDYHILEKEYERMCERQRKVLSEAGRPVLAPGWVSSLKLPTSVLSLWEQQELERTKDKLRDVGYEISARDRVVTSLDARLRTFSYPPNLGWGIGVLGYLAVFGILLPVLIIWKEAYSDIAKTLTVASFYIGIIGIFAYIVFQIRALRRK